MSLFRRPKKPMQRRVFGADDEEHNDENNGSGQDQTGKSVDDVMDVDTPPPPSLKERRSDKKASRDVEKSSTKSSLLSFGDEDEEGEVFQVKKSSQSKKVMKMLDKERRKKKSAAKEKDDGDSGHQRSTQSASSRHSESRSHHHYRDDDDDYDRRRDHYGERSTTASNARTVHDNSDSNNKNKRNKNSDSNIHTEIRTDDFVLVVKQSEPHAGSSSDAKLILNGRAALCAGRDDMSSDDDEDTNGKTQHRFAKPDNFRTVLESGAIPDAAMIHEARKKRQKAREQGDFIEIEEKKPSKPSNSCLVREEDDDDQSDEERVDMNDITGAKEREERREKFYSMQRELSDEETDPDMDEWENQQIRKGVTGAQLVSAQQEYSQYMIRPTEVAAKSTVKLLEQAYSHIMLHKPIHERSTSRKTEQEQRDPAQIIAAVRHRVTQLNELHEKHVADIDRMARELKLLKMEELDCEQKGPLAASKFRFFQEFRGYVQDLVECLDEKVPKIVELERRAIGCISKQANALIERRRQDVRDQAKEMAQLGKPAIKGKPNEEEVRIRRTAEREGRRTRRRRDRERIDIKNTHLDGMSSDDEIPDQEAAAYRSQLKLVEAEAANVFEDVTDEFSQMNNILNRFEEWRKYDFDSYKDTYVSLCLPKFVSDSFHTHILCILQILGPMVRLSLITWNPLEDCIDFEQMEWYKTAIGYALNADEKEEALLDDPDIRMLPTIIEKIILPKITEFIETCWDPLSTTETLKLVGLIRRLERDYPSLHPTSKYTRTLFMAILDKMKNAMDNDVFIPIFPKQHQEGKSSFFQRQFSSALKLLRNIMSWQGILSDIALRDIAINALLNRYLLSAMRVCNLVDAISKAYTILNTLPRVWLQSGSKILTSLVPFRTFLESVSPQLDSKNPLHGDSIEIVNRLLSRLSNIE